MSRNERNGGDMIKNGWQCRNMMENVGKCAEMRRKTEKDGEKKRKENNTIKSALNLDKILKRAS